MSAPEPAGGPIVVGVSPTTGSIPAVEWALDQARRQGRTLLAVSAWQVPRAAPPAALAPADQAVVVANLADEARTALAKTVRALAGETSTVEQRVVQGAPVAVLLAACEGAEMLVIGSPHPGELTRLRPSLLAPQLVYKAPCPVVVMPGSTHGETEGGGARRLAARVAAAAAAAGRPGLRLPPTPAG